MPAQCQGLLHLSLCWPCEQSGAGGEDWEWGQLGQLPQTDQRYISSHIMWHSEVKLGGVLPQEVFTWLGIRLQVVSDCLCITWFFLGLFNLIFLPDCLYLDSQAFLTLALQVLSPILLGGEGVGAELPDRLSPPQCPKQSRVCGVTGWCSLWLRLWSQLCSTICTALISDFKSFREKLGAGIVSRRGKGSKVKQVSHKQQKKRCSLML